MATMNISRIKDSTYVTISMIALCVAGVISWVFLMAGTAAVEAHDDEFKNAVIDVGFSWWLMIYTAILYIGALLSWIGSMFYGVGLFVALSRPLELLFVVAFTWTGVELRSARIVTGDTSEADAWFTGLFFTALALSLYMLFFATWQEVVNIKRAGKVRGAAAGKPAEAAGEAVPPGNIPAPPGAAAIIASANPPVNQEVYWTPAAPRP